MTLTGRLLDLCLPADRLTVLIFHRVLPARDELWPDEWDAAEFDRICSWMSQWARVLPLDEAMERLATGDLPPRAACLTFDDGYADNHLVARPILMKHGLCATFFVSTGFLDGGRMWNDTITETVRMSRRETLEFAGPRLRSLSGMSLQTQAERRATLRQLIRAVKYLQPAERAEALDELLPVAGVQAHQLPTDLMMSSEQLRLLRSSGMQIGAHTVTHPILARLDDRRAEQEIADSREALQGLLGEKISLFAYPNGRPGEDYGARDVALVRRLGFRGAVSTAPGAARRTSDCYQLPRFTPWDRGRVKFGLRLGLQLTSAQAPKQLLMPG
jgi:peptidoglycan/xylan/chitin deacetylase (PgdA/CDA1 family)